MDAVGDKAAFTHSETGLVTDMEVVLLIFEVCDPHIDERSRFAFVNDNIVFVNGCKRNLTPRDKDI